ncbi:hypothetical protein F5B20DRAFT_566780, partial [Whalleya microplaca]
MVPPKKMTTSAAISSPKAVSPSISSGASMSFSAGSRFVLGCVVYVCMVCVFVISIVCGLFGAWLVPLFMCVECAMFLSFCMTMNV